MHPARILGGLALLATADAAMAQNAPFLNINPSWSPDGRRLVFESRRHGDAELYIINADGTGERRLTWSGGEDTHAAWSPDGSTIVFDSDRDGNVEPLADPARRHRRASAHPPQLEPRLDVCASPVRGAGRPMDRLRLRPRRRGVRDGRGRRQRRSDHDEPRPRWACDLVARRAIAPRHIRSERESGRLESTSPPDRPAPSRCTRPQRAVRANVDGTGLTTLTRGSEGLR